MKCEETWQKAEKPRRPCRTVTAGEEKGVSLNRSYWERMKESRCQRYNESLRLQESYEQSIKKWDASP